MKNKLYKKVTNNNKMSIFKRLIIFFCVVVAIQLVVLSAFFSYYNINKSDDEVITNKAFYKFLNDLHTFTHYMCDLEYLGGEFQFQLNLNNINEEYLKGQDFHNYIIDFIDNTSITDISVSYADSNMSNIYFSQDLENKDNINMYAGNFELEFNDNISKKQVTSFYYSNLAFKDIVKYFVDKDKTSKGVYSKSFYVNTQTVMSYTIPLYEDNDIIAYVSFHIKNEDMSNATEIFTEGAKEHASLNLVSRYENDSESDKTQVTFKKITGTKFQFSNNENIALENEQYIFNKSDDLEDVYDLSKVNYGDKQLYTKFVSLPPTNILYGEEWGLLFIAESEYFNVSSNDLLSYVFISLAVAFLIGFISVVFIAIWMRKSLLDLINYFDKLTLYNNAAIERTGVKEYDKLIESVERLNNNVVESSDKFSKILQILDMQIAEFEYDKDGENVYVSATFIDMLELEDLEVKSQIITYDRFINSMDRFINEPQEDNEDVYYMITKEGKRHFEIKSIAEEKVIGVIIDISKEVSKSKQLQYELDHDTLTHLSNRRSFTTKVNNLLATEDIKISALIMFDLDNLKVINDKYGHDYGDKYLKLVAQVIDKESFYNCVVSRFSGDEFYMFFYNYNTKNEIREILDLIKMEMNTTSLKIPEGKDFYIRASCGITWYPSDSTSFDALMKYADFAMYKAKVTNKGNIVEFNKDQYNDESFFVEGTQELNDLLANEDIEFFFQPIVDLKDGKIIAYEALMRPTKLIQGPAEILALAKRQHQLYDIEKLTWFKVLETVDTISESFRNKKIFINSISSVALTDSDISYLVEVYGKYFTKVVLEITETEYLSSELSKQKEELARKLDMEMAIDDFGSGYSNLRTITLVNANYIKIDYEIVHNIHNDIKCQYIFKEAIDFAHKNNMKVIAEGIEVKEELEFVINNGADLGQGYYLGSPQLDPINKIKEKIYNEINLINK